MFIVEFHFDVLNRVGICEDVVAVIFLICIIVVEMVDLVGMAVVADLVGVSVFIVFVVGFDEVSVVGAIVGLDIVDTLSMLSELCGQICCTFLPRKLFHIWVMIIPEPFAALPVM